MEPDSHMECEPCFLICCSPAKAILPVLVSDVLGSLLRDWARVSWASTVVLHKAWKRFC